MLLLIKHKDVDIEMAYYIPYYGMPLWQQNFGNEPPCPIMSHPNLDPVKMISFLCCVTLYDTIGTKID